MCLVGDTAKVYWSSTYKCWLYEELGRSATASAAALSIEGTFYFAGGQKGRGDILFCRGSESNIKGTVIFKPWQLVMGAAAWACSCIWLVAQLGDLQLNARARQSWVPAVFCLPHTKQHLWWKSDLCQFGASSEAGTAG